MSRFSGPPTESHLFRSTKSNKFESRLHFEVGARPCQLRQAAILLFQTGQKTLNPQIRLAALVLFGRIALRQRAQPCAPGNGPSRSNGPRQDRGRVVTVAGNSWMTGVRWTWHGGAL